MITQQIAGPGDFRQFPTAAGKPHHDKTRHHCQAAATGHQQRLPGGAASHFRFMIEANEQIRGNRSQLPKYKQRDQVVRRYKTDHGQHEQRQIQTKSTDLFMPCQIGPGIKRYKNPGAADNDRKQYT